MFVDLLTRKAANAGGRVEEINTRKTKLSLDLHLAGQLRRNRLARDITFVSVTSKHSGICSYAFLAEACSNDTLDMCQAEVAWPAAEPLLKRAMSRLSTQTANHRLLPASFGLSQVQRQSCSPVVDGSAVIEAVDAVTVGLSQQLREPRRDACLAVRTPWL